jgi:hypothetical protein
MTSEGVGGAGHLERLQTGSNQLPRGPNTTILLAPCVQHDNAHGQEVGHVWCGHQLPLGAAAVQHDAEGVQATQVQSGGEGRGSSAVHAIKLPLVATELLSAPPHTHAPSTTMRQTTERSWEGRARIQYPSLKHTPHHPLSRA